MKQRSAAIMKGVPLALASAFLLLLAGCANKQTMGDLGHREPPVVADAYARAFGDKLPPPRDVTPPAPPAEASDDQSKASIVELREELAASSNQTQQSLDGMGVQLGKLGETVKLAEVNIPLKVQQQIDMHATATAQALNDWKNSLRIEMRNEFEAQFEARNQQLAAWQATVNEQRQEIKAQRDAYVQQIQYTAEMRDKDIASYEAMVAGAREQGYVSTAIVSALALLIGRIVNRLSKTIVDVDSDGKITKRLPPKGAAA